MFISCICNYIQTQEVIECMFTEPTARLKTK